MDGKFLSLKWNNHWSTFFTTLPDIRRKEVYSDVTLACSDNFYPAHKLVLSVCSEYFQQIFERIDCKHPVVVLKDIACNDLEALLNYMYNGEVSVLQDDLANLIKAAECLKIKGLAVPDCDPAKRNSENSDLPSPKNKRTFTDESSSESDVKKHRCDNDASPKSPLKDLEQIRISDKLSTNSSAIMKQKNTESVSLPFEVKNSLQRKSEDYSSDDVICMDTSNNVKEEYEDSYIEFDPLKDEEYSEDTNVDYSFEEGDMPQQYQDFLTSNSNSLLEQDHALQTPSELFGSSAPGGESSQTHASSEVLGNKHRCLMCPYTTSIATNMKNHVRAHRGERPYKCRYCSYRATQKANVKRHYIRHHIEQWQTVLCDEDYILFPN